MNSSRKAILKQIADHRNLFLGYACADNDLALVELVHGVGFIAGTLTWNEREGVKEKFDHRSHLLQVAAFAAGWVERLADAKNKDRVFELIDKERERQEALFLAGKISFQCSSPVVDVKRKIRVLIEELGEVAEEIDGMEQQARMVSTHCLSQELVQVAAVCVAWLESLEVTTNRKGKS